MMLKPGVPDLFRPVLFLGLLVSIPAFYLLLSGDAPEWRELGDVFYLATALLVAVDVLRRLRRMPHAHRLRRDLLVDGCIVVLAAVSAWPDWARWVGVAWTGRVVLCALVFSRLVQLAWHWVGPNHLFQVALLSVTMLAGAGAGFLWIEPTVDTYADGLWLAFTTAATVGYGDFVPTTLGSRIFAGFIVLLGYAVFSLVTASIAALFVSVDERRLERELHHDVRALRREIEVLRQELRQELRTDLREELQQDLREELRRDPRAATVARGRAAEDVDG